MMRTRKLGSTASSPALWRPWRPTPPAPVAAAPSGTSSDATQRTPRPTSRSLRSTSTNRARMSGSVCDSCKSLTSIGAGSSRAPEPVHTTTLMLRRTQNSIRYALVSTLSMQSTRTSGRYGSQSNRLGVGGSIEERSPRDPRDTPAPQALRNMTLHDKHFRPIRHRRAPQPRADSAN
jgi:hypothetical protein